MYVMSWCYVIVAFTSLWCRVVVLRLVVMSWRNVIVVLRHCCVISLWCYVIVVLRRCGVYVVVLTKTVTFFLTFNTYFYRVNLHAFPVLRAEHTAIVPRLLSLCHQKGGHSSSPAVSATSLNRNKIINEYRPRCAAMCDPDL